MGFFTADLCDNFSDKTEVLGPDFHSYGGNKKFKGEVITVKLNKNNNQNKPHANSKCSSAKKLVFLIAYFTFLFSQFLDLIFLLLQICL